MAGSNPSRSTADDISLRLKLATPTPYTTENITDIVADGDILLETDYSPDHERVSYRVSMQQLRSSCRYFAALLDTSRYLEGGAIESIHNDILTSGSTPSTSPASALPRVRISDVGPVTPTSSSRKVFSDLLRILHELDVSISRPSLTYMANLGIVADRFDCLYRVAQYVRRTNMLQLLSGKHPDRASILIPEERTRQRVLVGWLLDQPEWLYSSSKRLILSGSCLWQDGEVSEGCERGLWWNLPDGLEGKLCRGQASHSTTNISPSQLAELYHRRVCLLSTLNSLVLHILSLYIASPPRLQCRLGYDSSPACDSFQLGQMLRFLTRIDVLRIQGSIFPNSSPSSSHESLPASYTGEIDALFSSLRQCPSYQIDTNHTHCGMRTRLLPALEPLRVWRDTELGICPSCWKADRAGYRWYEGEATGEWYPMAGSDLPEVTGYPEGGVGRCRGEVGKASREKASETRVGAEAELGVSVGLGKETSTGTKHEVRTRSCFGSKRSHQLAKAWFISEKRNWDDLLSS